MIPGLLGILKAGGGMRLGPAYPRELFFQTLEQFPALGEKRPGPSLGGNP